VAETWANSSAEGASGSGAASSGLTSEARREDGVNSAAKRVDGAGIDLHLEVAGTRVRSGLEAALREAIRTGRLAAGTKLPPSRALAADLGLARNTVAEAYG